MELGMIAQQAASLLKHFKGHLSNPMSDMSRNAVAGYNAADFAVRFVYAAICSQNESLAISQCSI